jgi:biopolymer transport protein ExbD
MMDDSGNLKLNGEEKGTVSDTGKLETLLSAVLKERTEKGVFREGANEIEKTVLLRASGSSKYGDVVKLVDALKGSGADPIVIGLDEPEPVTAVEKLDSGSYDEDDSPGNTNSRE